VGSAFLIFIASMLGAETYPSVKFEIPKSYGSLIITYATSSLVGREGFLWFSTLAGLFRYDGYSTKWYKHMPDNPNSLSSNAAIRKPKVDEVVTVRVRIGGEVAHPAYREHSTELKKIYQELQVPLWKRKWLPLFYYGDQLVAIPDVFMTK